MNKLLPIFIALTILSACGDGGSDSRDTQGSSDTATISISGNAVKGPLAGATVNAYLINLSESDLISGAPIGQGTTNSQAEIEGLVIPGNVTLPIIIEVDGVTATDLNSGTTPVITTMRTLLTSEMLAMGNTVYITPLTTIALELARLNADRNTPPFSGDAMGSISLAEFENVLPIANEMMLASLGFGLDTNTNVFTTPPLVTNDITSDAELVNAAQYRFAIEALSALIVTLHDDINSNFPNSTDTNTLMIALAHDLADGNINGNSYSTPVNEFNGATNLLGLLNTNVSTLDIPGAINPDTGSSYKVTEIEILMAAQAEVTGATNVDITPLEQGRITPEAIVLEPDSDGDGLYDFEESSSEDVDNDGIVDQDDSANDDPCIPAVFNSNCPVDTDGDGSTDFAEGETADTDGDGTPNYLESSIIDTDADGVDDQDDPANNNVCIPSVFNDNCPTDTDSDGVSDFDEGENTDSDGDGTFDYQESSLNDTDNDGITDQTDAANNDACIPSAFNTNCAADTDSDGVSDFNEGETADSDGDGIFNYLESTNRDADNDGLNDQIDQANNNPCIPNIFINACEQDSDSDGVSDFDEGETADTDSDGLFDYQESSITDNDSDGINNQNDPANNDACIPSVFNSNCPTDTDNDGVSDFNEGENTDTDADGMLDYLESSQTDTDSDGINDQLDATNNNPCLPSSFNVNCTQDTDGDGISDFNEGELTDTDNDGKPDHTESTLTDADADGTNDQQDPADNDPCIPNSSITGCTTGITSRPTNPSCVAPVINNSADIELTRRYPNVSFSNPVKALQAPNDSSYWYVVEQNGNIKRFVNNDSTLQSETYLSIPVTSGGERGLLSLTFAPDWPSTNELYVYYTVDNSGLVSRISRLIINNDSTLPASYTEQILLTIDQPFDNHNGGDMAFGSDGYLYLGLGDGGSGNDPNDDGQNLTTLLGAMIRIDVNNVNYPSPGYNIPSDNPFSGNSKCGPANNANACPEIYAWGLRNPWRWSFDSQTNALWLGDVGQGAREEIDIIVNAGNYGWRCKEASLTTGLSSAHSNCATDSFIDPVHEYNHSSGNRSVTGGFVYRGAAIEALQGRYIFADYLSGRIWALSGNTETGFQAEQLIDSNHFVSSFAQDHNGELYILSYLSGEIYQITEPSNASSTITMPGNIFDIGCVTPTTSGQPTSGLIPYQPKAPFWSDNASKARWVALPDGLTIDASNDQTWEYPNGTVTMKNFVVENQLIETRFFMRHPSGEWAGYTYEWNESETQASRVIGGKTRELTHTINPQTWIYPSEGECLQCHTAAAGRLLGMNTPQLNHDYLYPDSGVTDNQLETFNHINLFTLDVTEPVTVLPTITDPEDSGESLTQRAKAYLHTNCSSCHQPSGGTPANMDLRYETNLDLMGICDVDPLLGSFGTADKLIKPGSASESIVLYRMNRRDNDGMPPIGSNVIDAAGVQLISDWINSLSDCN